MCDFCTKHGEGKKWYLQAKNYGEDLASDLRRRRFADHFFNEMMKDGRGSVKQSMEMLHRTPAILRRMVNGMISRRMKRDHFGQVVPLEDVERILEICSGIVRIPCVCRRMTQGKDAAYCLGVSVNPHRFWTDGVVGKDYWSGPDSPGLERLTREQALDLVREFEKEGLCHSVWAFVTPFIGGVCNCDRSDCYAMIYTLRERVKIMFRGEYVAEIDGEKCTGCRMCMRQCQFGAIGYSAAQGKSFIETLACYGCGVCRAACKQDAIVLRDRASVPAVANVW